MNANEKKEQSEVFVRDYLSERAMREAREGNFPSFGYPSDGTFGLKFTKTGYIVWPPFNSEDMPNDGPAICPVFMAPSDSYPGDMYCEVQCSDGSCVCTYQLDVADTQEQAVNDWLVHAQSLMREFRQQIDKVLDFKTKV